MNLDGRLAPLVRSQPHPLVFLTVSGAHLYGFASPDSDWDLRGVHVLPLRQTVGLDPGPETIEVTRDCEGVEADLVTHDLRKFIRLLLRRNGYVLEQLLSPLVVRTSAVHDEMKSLASDCITRHHAHHYLGFARTQWTLFTNEDPPRVKPLLYTYRVLLTGIHLMRTGQIEANLVRLNEEARLPHVTDLIARKTAGSERGLMDQDETEFHREEFDRLTAELQRASETSRLPEAPTAHAALDDLLIRVRLQSGLCQAP